MHAVGIDPGYGMRWCKSLPILPQGSSEIQHHNADLWGASTTICHIFTAVSRIRFLSSMTLKCVCEREQTQPQKVWALSLMPAANEAVCQRNQMMLSTAVRANDSLGISTQGTILREWAPNFCPKWMDFEIHSPLSDQQQIIYIANNCIFSKKRCLSSDWRHHVENKESPWRASLASFWISTLPCGSQIYSWVLKY